MDFPQIVKQLRQERGWSQQEVADRVGLNKMTISQYENGKRKPFRKARRGSSWRACWKAWPSITART